MSTVEGNPLEPRFTSREKAVLRLLVDGYAVEEIAQTLDIAFGTVQQHLANMRSKLDPGPSLNRPTG
jgi:DNA-binding NarL/FixJ family response regulator